MGVAIIRNGASGKRSCRIRLRRSSAADWAVEYMLLPLTSTTSIGRRFLEKTTISAGAVLMEKLGIGRARIISSLWQPTLLCKFYRFGGRVRGGLLGVIARKRAGSDGYRRGVMRFVAAIRWRQSGRAPFVV